MWIAMRGMVVVLGMISRLGSGGWRLGDWWGGGGGLKVGRLQVEGWGRLLDRDGVG
jgi:hypothetical protein